MAPLRTDLGSRLALTALWAVAGSLASLHAAAEAAPDRWKSGTYYAVAGGTTAVLVGGSLALRFVAVTTPGGDMDWFPGDVSLRGRHNERAGRLSDFLLVMTLAEPIAAQLGKGEGKRFFNTGLVYGQALSTSVFLNMLTKTLVGRPRPYTYGPGKALEDEDDWHVSFFSGHSSTAFTAATAGAYLFAESAPTRSARVVVWGGEMALAATTAGLRLRAGKHYYSDVLVGTLVGIGVGATIPVLNGARYAPAGEEYLAAGGGILFGAALSQVLPFEHSDQPLASATWSLGPVATLDGSPAFGAYGRFR